VLARRSRPSVAHVQVEHRRVADDHLLHRLRLDFALDVVLVAAEDEVACAELLDGPGPVGGHQRGAEGHLPPFETGT
jgi:hypothetical protein